LQRSPKRSGFQVLLSNKQREASLIMKKQLNHRMAMAIVGISSALVTGCANLPPSFQLPPTYQQPTLPAEDLAIISIDSTSQTLKFAAVDGAFISTRGGMLGALLSNYTREDQKIIPGKRSVNVNFEKGNGMFRVSKLITVNFEARAGERYTFHEESNLGPEGYALVSTWITDTSGATVPLITGTVAPITPN
jgi:hypothetical protein